MTVFLCAQMLWNLRKSFEKIAIRTRPNWSLKYVFHWQYFPVCSCLIADHVHLQSRTKFTKMKFWNQRVTKTLRPSAPMTTGRSARPWKTPLLSNWRRSTERPPPRFGVWTIRLDNGSSFSLGCNLYWCLIILRMGSGNEINWVRKIYIQMFLVIKRCHKKNIMKHARIVLDWSLISHPGPHSSPAPTRNLRHSQVDQPRESQAEHWHLRFWVSDVWSLILAKWKHDIWLILDLWSWWFKHF